MISELLTAVKAKFRDNYDRFLVRITPIPHELPDDLGHSVEELPDVFGHSVHGKN